MPKKYNFDYIIIGGGPAGVAAAKKLLRAKKRVALVEGHLFGGSHLNSRDLPYRLGLNFAHTFSSLGTFPAFSGQDFHYNFPAVVTHSAYKVLKLREKSLQELKDLGVTYLEGYAHFLDENTVAVSGTNYTASTFILATGSTLKTSGLAGLETVNYLTPDTALRVKRLPKYVFVVGGGSTGCEIAAYFAELGTKVILMERAHRLLPREDKEVSAAITDYFKDELGIMVITNAKVVALEQDDISKRVIFNAFGQEKLVRIDCIVLATGSRPATDFGLENAGVKYKNSGIVIDKTFQTTAKNIFAIGDATGNPGGDSSTLRARYEGELLAENLLHRTKTSPNYAGFTRLVATSPAVATVGLNEYNLLSSDRRYKKSIVYFKDLPLIEPTPGFVKLLADPTGRLLGASVVAKDAEFLARELALAVRHRRTVATLANLPYDENLISSAIPLAAKKLA